jgi:hypothetical protein
MSSFNTHPHSTLPQLIKATGVALVAAGAILVIAVLPAEHGIDPTGIGKTLGLTTLSTNSGETPSALLSAASAARLPSNTAALAPVVQTPVTTVTESDVPFRSDQMSLTLQPGEGAEIKASMRKGEQFVFAWAAKGGKVNFDMHGEQPNAGDEFTSYWKARQHTRAQGTFVAPFDGTHGWYWRNRGDKPVRVKVNVSGFYEKLYRPN